MIQRLRQDALIGHTGFVGANLAAARPFAHLYNSGNFREMTGRRFGTLVCSGVSAVKWQANKDPAGDWSRIQMLADVMKTVVADEVVLISTIDVYPVPTGADEAYAFGSAENHAYGSNRLAFERLVRAMFPLVRTVRLPALFGPGLRKNALHDMIRGHMLEPINPASRFQWYDLGRLADDVDRMRAADLTALNLFTEPLATREIAEACGFDDPRIGAAPAPRAEYDLWTRHADVFGRPGDRYVAGRAEVLASIVRFVDAERARLSADAAEAAR